MMPSTPARIAAWNGTNSSDCKAPSEMRHAGKSRCESTSVSPWPGNVCPRRSPCGAACPGPSAGQLATVLASEPNERVPITGLSGLNDVDDGRQIHVHAHCQQFGRRGFGDSSRQRRSPLAADGHVAREDRRADGDAHHQAALRVDGDEQWHRSAMVCSAASSRRELGPSSMLRANSVTPPRCRPWIRARLSA